MADDLLLGLFDQILNFVLFLFVTADEFLLLPGPSLGDVSNKFYVMSVFNCQGRRGHWGDGSYVSGR